MPRADESPDLTPYALTSATWDHGTQIVGLTDNDHTLYIRGSTNNFALHCGTAIITSGTSVSVTFSSSFSAVPITVVSPFGAIIQDEQRFSITAVSTGTFSVASYAVTSFSWVAVGVAP
jgi:hypothetical protein